MSRSIEPPVTTAEGGPDNSTSTTHPAFAQISASRVSGTTALAVVGG